MHYNPNFLAKRMKFARCFFTAMIASIWSNSVLAETTIEGIAGGIIETVVYSIIGIIMAVIGFKVVDWLTPGDLADEVTHKENRALAILAGSMMLGVCIIIASVLIG